MDGLVNGPAPGHAGRMTTGTIQLRRDAGQLLRRRRQAAGITQEQLAARAHVSQPLISKIERGLYRATTLDHLEALFAVLGLELRVRAQTAHADLDREISKLARLSISDRLFQSCALDALRSLEQWGPVPFVIEGALAAVLQGAPIPIDEPDVAVARDDLEDFEQWLARSGAMPWSDEWQDFRYLIIDLQSADELRWRTGLDTFRTRFVDAPPTSIEVTHEGETYRVRPLAEVEVVDAHAAELMARWRELVASGSTQLSNAGRPVAAVADEFDQA